MKIKREDMLEAVATEPLRHGNFDFKVQHETSDIEVGDICDVCAVGAILRRAIGCGSYSLKRNSFVSRSQFIFLQAVADVFEGSASPLPDPERYSRYWAEEKATNEDREITMCFIAQNCPEVLE